MQRSTKKKQQQKRTRSSIIVYELSLFLFLSQFAVVCVYECECFVEDVLLLNIDMTLHSDICFSSFPFNENWLIKIYISSATSFFVF